MDSNETTIAKLEAWRALADPYLSSQADPTAQALDRIEAWQALEAAYLDSLAPTPPPPAGTLPLHRLGVHWIPASNRAADHDYMRRLRPGAIKVISLDANRIKEAMSYLDTASEAVLVIRDHPLSEEKDAMTADPVGTGKRHAASWRNKFVVSGALASIPTERVVVCGINEPFVQNEAQEKIVFAYTKAFLEALTTYGLRGLALNLSVGWPRNNDTATVKNTKPIWDTFRPLEDIINAGPGHILGLHEYWRDDPDESWYTAPGGERWGWNAQRHWACPLSCRIIIGECGMTKEVAGLPAPGQSEGWIGNISAPAYAEQLHRYTEKCHPNVLAVMPFTTDGNQDWAMDDTAGAHADILARKHAYAWPTVWPVTKTITPPVDPPEETMSDPKLLIYPRYTGHVTNFYGELFRGYSHEGLDISAEAGVPVYAPYDGVVAYADYEPTTYGNYVRISTALNVDFFFGHFSKSLVKTGDRVTQGQKIGEVGSTGNSTGNHIHFEARLKIPGDGYRTGVTSHGNARVDVIALAAGWLAAGNKIIER